MQVWDQANYRNLLSIEMQNAIMKFTTLAADPQYLICAAQNGDIMIVNTNSH
jgi:hypothetical protein